MTANEFRVRPAAADIWDAASRGQYGVVLRLIRQGKGLTQEQAGRLAGYSAATISRLETGARRLADVATLRHLAGALEVTPEVFGLTPGAVPGGAGAAASEAGGSLATVITSTSQDGDDDVRRRELLAGLPAALLMPAAARAGLPGVRESVRQGIAAAGPAGPLARDQLAAAVRYYDLNFSRFPPAQLAAEVDRMRVLADNNAALIHLGPAARLGTATGDDDLVCWALGAQAMTANTQGRHPEALELAHDAYEYAHSPLRRAQILAWAQLRSLAGLGDQHRADAARVMAMAHQMAADPLGEQPGRFGFDLAELRLHLAESNLALGSPAQARAHALASAEHTTKGRPGWAAAVLVLARGEAARKNHGDAAALARQVLDAIPARALRETSRARLRDLDADLFTGAAPSRAARELRDRLHALLSLQPARRP